MTAESKKIEADSFEQERNEALAALRRARVRAEKLAADTGTALIIAVDGKPVRVFPLAPSTLEGRPTGDTGNSSA
jgi:hypothetical protein